jgi:uncharacterized protein YndB with AHSA1/START domain
MAGTVRLHQVFSAPPERVFKAFIDPDALVKWMAPHGFTAKVHHLDPQQGGTYKMSFTNFSTGRPTHLAAPMLKLFLMNYCVTQISLMIRIWSVRYKSQFN